MAELRQAQQRRRNLRRGIVVGAAVVIAVVLAIVTTTGGGSSKKIKTTTALAPSPGALTATATAALATVAAPPVSPNCATPAPASTGATTTVPAKGNAVATIDAPANVPFPALDGTAPHYTKFTAYPPFCIDVTKSYLAVVQTDVGPITIQLLPANAPATVNNFVFLAGYHYFNGMVFHRVIPGFVDQGGDPTGTGSGGPGYQFGDELPTSPAAYDAGAVAMANSGANTNGSQFFMVVGTGGKQLTSPAYSMFGQVVDGINIMNKINADGSSSGTPTVPHHIISVTIKVAAPAPPPTTTTATTAPPTTAATTTAPPTTAAPTTVAPPSSVTTVPPPG